MKLVLYSGGERRQNKVLDGEMISMAASRRPGITYIPSSSDYGQWEFGEFVTHFTKKGVNHFVYFPIDIPFTKTLLQRALEQDIVYLSGGNTFYFLKHLKKAGLIPLLRERVSEGMVLAGLSAGSILMTPNIRTAGFPSFDRDLNSVGIKNLDSLGLVDFEFYPHYEHVKDYRKELVRYSDRNPRALYACPDGAGVVVADDGVHVVGRCWEYKHGVIKKL